MFSTVKNAMCTFTTVMHIFLHVHFTALCSSSTTVWTNLTRIIRWNCIIPCWKYNTSPTIDHFCIFITCIVKQVCAVVINMRCFKNPIRGSAEIRLYIPFWKWSKHFEKQFFVVFCSNSNFELYTSVVICIRALLVARVEITAVAASFGGCPEWRLFSTIQTTSISIQTFRVR